MIRVRPHADHSFAIANNSASTCSLIVQGYPEILPDRPAIFSQAFFCCFLAGFLVVGYLSSAFPLTKVVQTGLFATRQVPVAQSCLFVPSCFLFLLPGVGISFRSLPSLIDAPSPFPKGTSPPLLPKLPFSFLTFFFFTTAFKFSLAFYMIVPFPLLPPPTKSAALFSACRVPVFYAGRDEVTGFSRSDIAAFVSPPPTGRGGS